MTFRKYAYLVTLLAAVLLVVAACAAPAAAPGGAAATTAATAAAGSTTQAAAGGKPINVLLFINGTLGDKSFFDSAQRGIDQAKQELGIQAKTIEASYDSAQWEPALVDALNNNKYDVVVLGTSDMVPYAEKLAPKYPDVKFIFFDDMVDPTKCANQCANVYSMTYKQNEGSYLAGVYAAAMTTQKLDGMNPDAVIGAVGGQQIPVILDFMVGYEQGAKSVNPQIKVLRQFADSWNDPAKGKELAKAQYSQGADIVFQIAGGTGQGVFEAAAEDGHYAIGVDSDQAAVLMQSNPAQAQRILTSMMKNVDKSVVRALKLHQEGKLPYGKAEALGLAEGGNALARNDIYNKITPDSVKKLVDDAEQKIIKGEIKVDTAMQ